MKSFSQYIEKVVEDYYDRFGIIAESDEKEKQVDPDDVDKESNTKKIEKPARKKRKVIKRDDLAVKIPRVGK